MAEETLTAAMIWKNSTPPLTQAAAGQHFDQMEATAVDEWLCEDVATRTSKLTAVNMLLLASDHPDAGVMLSPGAVIAIGNLANYGLQKLLLIIHEREVEAAAEQANGR